MANQRVLARKAEPADQGYGWWSGGSDPALPAGGAPDAPGWEWELRVRASTPFRSCLSFPGNWK